VRATRGTDGAPQAALVGITATWRGELDFNTSRSSRKHRNLSTFAQVALVIGWNDEMTVQCEGIADIPTGADPIAVCRPTLPRTPMVWNAPTSRHRARPHPPKLATVQRLPAGVLQRRGDHSGALTGGDHALAHGVEVTRAAGSDRRVHTQAARSDDG
jgi:hypothetical protein